MYLLQDKKKTRATTSLLIVCDRHVGFHRWSAYMHVWQAMIHIHPWTRSWDGVAVRLDIASQEGASKQARTRSIERRAGDGWMPTARSRHSFLDRESPTNASLDRISERSSIGNRMPSLLSMPLPPPQGKNIFSPIVVYVYMRAYSTLLTKQMHVSFFHVHKS
jgi:hypothetical protein